MFYHLHLEKAKVEMGGVGYKVGGPWPWPSQRKSCLDKMVGCGGQVRGGGDQVLDCAEWERSGSWPLEFWPRLLKVGRREEE